MYKRLCSFAFALVFIVPSLTSIVTAIEYRDCRNVLNADARAEIGAQILKATHEFGASVPSYVGGSLRRLNEKQLDSNRINFEIYTVETGSVKSVGIYIPFQGGRGGYGEMAGSLTPKKTITVEDVVAMLCLSKKFESEKFSYEYSYLTGDNIFKDIPSYYAAIPDIDEHTPEKFSKFVCKDSDDVIFEVFRSNMMQHLTFVDIGEDTKALVCIKRWEQIK